MANDQHGISPTDTTGPWETRELLMVLGFEAFVARFTERQPGYRFDFGNLELQAVQLYNEYMCPGMLFIGVHSGPRILGTVQFELNLTMESYEQGVALIANRLGRNFKPSRQTDWLDQGRQWTEHLPWRKGMRLYEIRPQCHVQADWFRVAVKKLIEYGAAAEQESMFTTSYQDGELKFEMPGQKLVMPAQGTSWPQTYQCRSKGLEHLSKRTPSTGVWVSAWEDILTIDRLRLPIEPDKTGATIQSSALSAQTSSRVSGR